MSRDLLVLRAGAERVAHALIDAEDLLCGTRLMSHQSLRTRDRHERVVLEHHERRTLTLTLIYQVRCQENNDAFCLIHPRSFPSQASINLNWNIRKLF